MEFTQLALYSPQFVSSEEERCDRFLEGLRDSLKLPLVPLRVTDYAELVERAKLLENSLARAQHQQQGDSSGGRRRFQGESAHGKSPRKKGGYGPSRSGQSSEKSGGAAGSGDDTSGRAPLCAMCGKWHHGRCYRQSGQCYRCGQHGHLRAQCPLKDSEGGVEIIKPLKIL